MNSQREEIPCPVAGCPWAMARTEPQLVHPPAGSPAGDMSFMQAMVCEGILVAAREDERRIRAHLRGHSRQALGDDLWELLYGREPAS